MVLAFGNVGQGAEQTGGHAFVVPLGHDAVRLDPDPAIPRPEAELPPPPLLVSGEQHADTLLDQWKIIRVCPCLEVLHRPIAFQRHLAQDLAPLGSEKKILKWRLEVPK